MSGCGELPEVRYETRNIDIATDFDAPVCRGTRVALDERFDLVSQLLRDEPPERMLLYWVDHDIERVCSGHKLGCFIPGTRIAASYSGALHHEVVHAVLDTRGRNVFLEEGLAEYLGGYPIVYDPERGDPLGELTKGDSTTERGGSFTYQSAASFAHFLGREGGEPLLENLVAAVDRGASGESIRELIERELELEGDELESYYQDTTATVMPGLSRLTVRTTPLESLESIHRFDLDCESSDTYGPLDPAQAEGFQIQRFVLPRRATLRWRVTGSPSTWAAIIPTYDPKHRRALDWLTPTLDRLDHHRRDVGDPAIEIELDAGEHALLVAGPSDEEQEVFVELLNVRLHYPEPQRDHTGTEGL